MIVSRADRSLLSDWWLTIDRRLLGGVLLLILAGLVVVAAASPAVAIRKGLAASHFVERHLLVAALSVVVMLAVSLLRPPALVMLAALLFVGAVAGMALAIHTGDEINGARRWIRVAGLSLQPSELAKPAFALLAATALADRARRPGLGRFAVALGLFLFLAGVLALQPDVGQAVLAGLVLGALLIASGQPLWRVAAVGALGAAGLALAYASLGHVRLRIDRFLTPSVGDRSQLDRALQSFVEGGLVGRGPGEGTIKTVLPDAHTDFVLAVVAEEYGALGCVALVGLIAFVTLRPLMAAAHEHDPRVRLSIVGLSVMIAAQSLINMGVNVGLLPAKGMTLPFVSTGGSSMIATAIGAGALLALTRRRPRSPAELSIGAFDRRATEPAPHLGARWRAR